MTLTMRVVGFDLSLTSTGMSDGSSVLAVQTGPEKSTEARMHKIVRECTSFALSPYQWSDMYREGHRADLAVIEGAAYGSKGDAVDQLAGLRWLVRVKLYDLGIPFAIVPPSTLKAYTTGNGRATKQQMVDALIDRHGVPLKLYKVKDGRYDMADAYALAVMGLAALEQPLPAEGPPAPLKSLLAVQWPTVGNYFTRFSERQS